jgi:hypothetical protein
VRRRRKGLVCGAGTPVQPDAWIAAEAEHQRPQADGRAPRRPERAHALAAVGLPAADADRYYGFSVILRGDTPAPTCEGLVGKVASTRRQNELQVAWW